MLYGRMSSNPRMWSACPCVSKTASSRSIFARSACCRKSGVVSMTTFCSPRDSKIEGRNRLSWGSAEVQTLQWHASEGTPIEVPEPRIVTFMGAAAIRTQIARQNKQNDKLEIDRGEFAKQSACFCLGLCLGLRLRGDRLVDLEISHLQLPEQVEQ